MMQATHSYAIPNVSYRLFRHNLIALQTEEFFLCVNSGDDFVCVSLGSDILIAESAYRIIVTGEVTPCTLLDVLDDLGVSYEQCFLLSGANVEICPTEDESVFSKKIALPA